VSDQIPPKPRKKKRNKYISVKHEHSLGAVSRDFATEDECLDYLHLMRWPSGVECVECGSKRVSKYQTNETSRERKNPKTGQVEIRRVPARRIYQCLDCKHQFTATAGTLFNDSHLPLNQWFKAIAIMCEAKKGVSARQIQSHLQIGSYRTAWYLNHRILEAMGEGEEAPLSGTVEIDETYVGGKAKNMHAKQRAEKIGGRGVHGKDTVLGMVERDGNVKTFHVPSLNRFHVIDKLKEGISVQTDLVCTDESNLYHRMPENIQRHEIVNHSAREYVRGEVHTGTIDGYWGLLKRGLIGSYHRVSIKHLHRYLIEFQMRWNNRKNPDLFALVVFRLLIGTALQYKQLIAEVEVEENEGPEVQLDGEPF
jgi:DNA-directed RNA polymerase subunit RPC12/RpoP